MKTLDTNMANYGSVVLETCAYAGTGDVLKIQQMLASAGEHIEVEDATPWKVRGSCPVIYGMSVARDWILCLASKCRKLL